MSFFVNGVKLGIDFISKGGGGEIVNIDLEDLQTKRLGYEIVFLSCVIEMGIVRILKGAYFEH